MKGKTYYDSMDFTPTTDANLPQLPKTSKENGDLRHRKLMMIRINF